MKKLAKIILIILGLGLIIGIFSALIYSYYTPYRNTQKIFPNHESELEYHITDCEQGETDNNSYFKYCVLNKVFYFEYMFQIYCNTNKDNVDVVLGQNRTGLLLNFNFNYTSLARCVCRYKINGYISGLTEGMHQIIILENIHIQEINGTDWNSTRGTYRFTI
jgi:hypothetical protein